MPQDSSGIFEYSNKDSHFSRIVFYRGSRMPFLCVEEFPQFTETCEAPVALFRDESVVRVYSQETSVKATYYDIA